MAHLLKSTRSLLVVVALLGLPGWCYCAMTSSLVSAAHAVTALTTSTGPDGGDHDCCKPHQDQKPQRDPTRCHCDCVIAGVQDTSVAVVTPNAATPDGLKSLVLAQDAPPFMQHDLFRPMLARAGPPGSWAEFGAERDSLIDRHCLLLV